MSLTHQPFANFSGPRTLGTDLKMNLSGGQRLFSIAAGASLLAVSLSRRGPGKWILGTIGTAMVQRGLSGQCAVYQRLGLDGRHEHKGVPGNRGIKVEHSIEISRSPEILYGYWRNLEQLPRVMRHVESVQSIGGKRTRWKVQGPLHQHLEWDAEIIHEEEGEQIAWQSLPGASVANAGSVHFEALEGGGTRLRVVFQYDPPAGVLGAKVAALLGHSPESELSTDLQSFKEFAERELPVWNS